MPSVAITGTRGYPSHYGGLETAVRHIAPYLAEHGWDVTVHSRKGLSQDTADAADPRVRVVPVWAVEKRSLSNLSSGLSSTIRTLRDRPDVVLVMSTGSGFWLPLLKLRGIPTVVNTDGLEWERDKWGRLAKAVLRTAAQMTARFADHLVFDARAIEDYWRHNFHRDGTYIPYGGDAECEGPLPSGIAPHTYVLLVARFVPENTVGPFLEAVPEIARHAPVVLVGSSGWGGELDERAKALSDELENVTWLGHVRETDLLNALYANAALYFHGHTVGGTNPSLVQAMTSGTPVLAIDTVYSHEVLGSAGRYTTAEGIARAVISLLDQPEARAQLGASARARAQDLFTWDHVCTTYERVLREATEK